MRQIMQIILFLFILSDSFSQDLIKALEKDNRIKKDKEFIKEIKVLNIRLIDSLDLNINSFNNIFIIRGVDIQSRTGYGLLWNDKIRINYVDNKKWQNNKIIDSDPKFEVNQKTNAWDDFSDILPLIEKWDTLSINKYVKKSNEETTILGGLYWWRILKLEKKDTRYNIEQLWIKEFTKVKK